MSRTKARIRRTRKHRRQAERASRFKGRRNPNPKHKGKSGRTGSMHSKKPKPKDGPTGSVHYHFHMPLSVFLHAIKEKHV